MGLAKNGDDYNRHEEIKQFDDTKAGVKGLVDSGVTKIPRFFVHRSEALENNRKFSQDDDISTFGLPTIDFHGVEKGGARHKEIVDQIRMASEKWGFFRIVNHGIPLDVMDDMLDGVRGFHEQPKEKKMHLYSCDGGKRVRFSSNEPLREHESACWRDLLTCVFLDDIIDPGIIPSVCRKQVQDYVKHIIQVRETMGELLSEALGLRSDYLHNTECMRSEALACLYYPPCPEPDKTLGAAKHSDTTFLTLLLQDTTGGLQILHDNQWLDVPPVRGALIANIGDHLQILSNDKFKSVEHRVLAQAKGPRVSIACFFTPSTTRGGKPFGPIKELLSDENPPIYRDFMCSEYIQYYKNKGQDGSSALPHYKIL